MCGIVDSSKPANIVQGIAASWKLSNIFTDGEFQKHVTYSLYGTINSWRPSHIFRTDL